VADGDAEAATPEDVRAIARRRRFDDLTARLALQCAERGTAWVLRDAGEPIGIAIAHDSDDERFVGDYYVEPSFRGQDAGTQLLRAAFDEAGDRSRATLVSPNDAAAQALALRFGMTLGEPILRMAGAIPPEEELAKMAAGDYRFEVAAIDAAAHGPALDELDRRSRGTARPADHAEFCLRAGGNAFFLRGECVGYAYVWADGMVGPIACASQAYLVQIFAYALVTLVRQYGASWCTALVPGSNRRIGRAALRARLRIEEALNFASDAFGGDFSTYVAYHRLLL